MKKRLLISRFPDSFNYFQLLSFNSQRYWTKFSTRKYKTYKKITLGIMYPQFESELSYLFLICKSFWLPRQSHKITTVLIINAGNFNISNKKNQYLMIINVGNLVNAHLYRLNSYQFKRKVKY
jgi:hypothetical protein